MTEALEMGITKTSTMRFAQHELAPVFEQGALAIDSCLLTK